MLKCHIININPAALGADNISVRDFNGNTFTMAKKFSGPSAGNSEQDIRKERELYLVDFRRIRKDC